MSVNCIRCVKRRRTGFDLLCDVCRDAELADLHALVPTTEAEVAAAEVELAPLECTGCGTATGPLHPIGADHPGWACATCYEKWANRRSAASSYDPPELKPCPFCGGPAYRPYDEYERWVQCRACGARTESGTIDSADADEAWNRRAAASLESLDVPPPVVSPASARGEKP
jgi:Lar family restriction alleviation protein